MNDSELLELAIAEYLDARHQGSSVSVDSLAAKYPSVADAFRSFVAQHEDLGDQMRGAQQALAANQGNGSDAPTIAHESGSKSTASNASGRRIRYFGDYELLEKIAQGGMGVVYRARQVSLNRIVAVKMILAGTLASKELVERFQREARAAALLDHPGIVPIYEVGVHDQQHFFSMGYIEGASLATKLLDGPMEPREAAKLVAQITHAIQYAHEHGIIHRDIKPSNILLDARGAPRVTDFGLAKQINEANELTVTGQILGTPSYMPPEQAAGHVDSVGPESDVYSLGALLYAMITGRPPFQAASSVETMRQVVEREPVAPKQLNESIPLDLQTIVLKCLDKSRPRRYASAQILRDELERFLAGRPILARPVGTFEKARRWCRRNPLAATLSTFLILALIAGTSVSSWFAWQERRRAVSESEARLIAERQRDIAKGLNSLVTHEIFGQVDIWTQAETEPTVDPNITVKTTLDRAARGAAERFAGQPEIEASIRRALGSAFVACGEPKKGIEQLEEALRLASQLPNQLPEEKQAFAETEYLLAKSYWADNRPQDADKAFRSSLNGAIRELGPTSRERLQVQTSLAVIHLGRGTESLRLLEELKPIVEKNFAEGDTDALHFKNTLGLAQQYANQMDDALATFTAAHQEAQSKLGDKNPLTMMILNNRARWYLINKQPAEGLAMFELLEPFISEQLGPDNPHTILTRGNLAFCCIAVGQFERADQLLQTVVPAMQSGLGPLDPRTRVAKLSWAKVLKELNQVERAAKLYAELWSDLPPDQPPIEVVYGLLSDASKQLVKSGNQIQFNRLATSILESLSRSKEPPTLEIAEELEYIGDQFIKATDVASALAWQRKAIEMRMELAPADWRTRLSELMLTELLLATHQSEQAMDLLARAWGELEPQIESIASEDRSLIADVIDRVINLMETAGDASGAQLWRAKLAIVRK